MSEKLGNVVMLNEGEKMSAEEMAKVLFGNKEKTGEKIATNDKTKSILDRGNNKNDYDLSFRMNSDKGNNKINYISTDTGGRDYVENNGRRQEVYTDTGGQEYTLGPDGKPKYVRTDTGGGKYINTENKGGNVVHHVPGLNKTINKKTINKKSIKIK